MHIAEKGIFDYVSKQAKTSLPSATLNKNLKQILIKRV